MQSNCVRSHIHKIYVVLFASRELSIKHVCKVLALGLASELKTPIPAYGNQWSHVALFVDGSSGGNKRKVHAVAGVLDTSHGRCTFSFGDPDILKEADDIATFELYAQRTMEATQEFFNVGSEEHPVLFVSAKFWKNVLGLCYTDQWFFGSETTGSWKRAFHGKLQAWDLDENPQEQQHVQEDVEDFNVSFFTDDVHHKAKQYEHLEEGSLQYDRQHQLVKVETRRSVIVLEFVKIDSIAI